MTDSTATFTVGSDTDLAFYTNDTGHTYTKYFGNVLTVVAAGDYLYNASPTNASRYECNVTPASAEYDVQADVISTIEWSGGISGRVVSADSDEYTFVYENSLWKLIRRDAGTSSTLATYSGDSTNGVSRTALLQIRDGAKKGFVGGVERVSSADNSLIAAGKPGIYWDGNSTGTQMDNWSSTDAVAAVSVSGGWYKTPRKRKKLIIDGKTYNVTPAEEAQIVQAHIDRLNDEKREAEQEVKKQQKILRIAKSTAPKKANYKPAQVVRVESKIEEIMESLRIIEFKRREAKEIKAQIERAIDDEEAISIIMAMEI